MSADRFVHKYSEKIILNTNSKNAFEYLDDPIKLSAHMGKSSLIMAGSKMKTLLDEKKGREIGSVIGMIGEFLGLKLSLQEKIVERVPHTKKYWQTFGIQNLIIIDQYKMGFNLSEQNPKKTELTISIEYNLPQSGPKKIAGTLFGAFYAKWCVKQMIADAKKTFSNPQKQ